MIIRTGVKRYGLVKRWLAKHRDITYPVLVVGKVSSSFVMW